MANSNARKAVSKFNLPASGYDSLTKILHAYALAGGKDVSLDTIAAKAGMGKTIVSPNHPFLRDVGIVDGGQKKSLTDAGRKLVVAISHGLDEDISAHWSSILLESAEVKSVLDMVRVQNRPFTDEELRKRIASTLNLSSSKTVTTGANCLIEILQRAGLLKRADQGLTTANDDKTPPRAKRHVTAPPNEEPEEDVTPPRTDKNGPGKSTPPLPTMHIDVQIHIAADAKPDQIDQIFASMAKHLYGKG